MSGLEKILKKNIINDLDFYEIENFFKESNNKSQLIDCYFEVNEYFIEFDLTDYFISLMKLCDEYIKSTDNPKKVIKLEFLNIRLYHITNRFDKALQTLFRIENILYLDSYIQMRVYNAISYVLYDYGFYKESYEYNNIILSNPDFKNMSDTFIKKVIINRIALRRNFFEFDFDFHSSKENLKDFINDVENIYLYFYQAMNKNDSNLLDEAKKRYKEYSISNNRDELLINSLRANLCIIKSYDYDKDYQFILDRLNDLLQYKYLSNDARIKVCEIKVDVLKNKNKDLYNDSLEEYVGLFKISRKRQNELIHSHIKNVFEINKYEELVEEMKKDVELDALTKCGNRKSLYRHGISFFKDNGALVYIDLNDLKQINDHYGHSFGDEYLKSFADILNKYANCGNIKCFRLGGDEFVILLNDYSKDEIKNIMDSIVKDCYKSFWIKSNNLTIYFSAGVSFYPQDGKTLNELLESADKEMYEIKSKKELWYKISNS